jgi:hypothetical protein
VLYFYMGKPSNFEKELEAVMHQLDLLEERLHLEQGTSKRSLEYMKQHLNKLWEAHNQQEERMNDSEIQVNLLTRLMTTICLERLGVRLSEFRKLIRRTEKELADDSEIAHLDGLFALDTKETKGKKSAGGKAEKPPKRRNKKTPPKPSSESDEGDE